MGWSLILGRCIGLSMAEERGGGGQFRSLGLGFLGCLRDKNGQLQQLQLKVGKSLLINKMRRLKPGAAEWAPTGVKETTLSPGTSGVAARNEGKHQHPTSFWDS